MDIGHQISVLKEYVFSQQDVTIIFVVLPAEYLS